MSFLTANSERLRTIARHARELAFPSGPPGILISHHKSASVWTWEVLKSGCRRNGIPVRRIPTHRRRGRLFQRACRVVMVIDSFDNMPMDHYQRTRLVHMTRDPRGILASMLQSHRSTHPIDRREFDPWGEIARNREALQRLDDDDGYRWLFQHATYLPRIIRQMVLIERDADPWDRIDHRDIADDPRDAIKRIVTPFGVPEADVDDLTAQFDFAKRRSDKGHYRRGDPDSWREELPEDVIRSFDERWGQDLETLGYPRSAG